MAIFISGKTLNKGRPPVCGRREEEEEEDGIAVLWICQRV
jgi:hypothetical protein